MNNSDILIFGPSGASDGPHMDLCSLELYVKPTVRNLVLIMDNDFKLDKQKNFVI